MNNIVILVGRISRNIELRTTQNGLSVCNITLAITRKYKNSNNEYGTDFITCVCYRQVAEMISKWCQKGDLIGIKGTIQSKTYEKDGKKVYTTEIIVEDITFLNSKSKEKKEELQPKDEFDKEIEDFSKEADLSVLNQEKLELPF